MQSYASGHVQDVTVKPRKHWNFLLSFVFVKHSQFLPSANSTRSGRAGRTLAQSVPKSALVWLQLLLAWRLTVSLKLCVARNGWRRNCTAKSTGRLSGIICSPGVRNWTSQTYPKLFCWHSWTMPDISFPALPLQNGVLQCLCMST